KWASKPEHYHSHQMNDRFVSAPKTDRSGLRRVMVAMIGRRAASTFLIRPVMRGGRQGQVENISISVILLQLKRSVPKLADSQCQRDLPNFGWVGKSGGRVLSLRGARMPKRDIVERLRDGTSAPHW